MIMTNAYTCPHCGARTTPFAAGCAYCGADLDPARRPPSPGLSARIRRAWRTRRHGAAPVPDRGAGR